MTTSSRKLVRAATADQTDVVDQHRLVAREAAPAATMPFTRRIVPIDWIQTGDAYDTDVSDSEIERLSFVVMRFGLKDPISVLADGSLVAGARWLAAVKKLGWKTVEVVIVGGCA